MCFIYWPFAVCAGGSRHRLHSGRSQSTHNNIENVFKKKELIGFISVSCRLIGCIYWRRLVLTSPHRPQQPPQNSLRLFSFLYTNIQQEMDIKAKAMLFYILSLLAFLLLLPHGIDFTNSILWREWKRRKSRSCDVIWSSLMHSPPPLLQCSSGLLMSIYITE